MVPKKKEEEEEVTWMEKKKEKKEEMIWVEKDQRSQKKEWRPRAKPNTETQTPVKPIQI